MIQSQYLVDYENRIRILSIDPASGSMGVTISDFNIETGILYPITCQTFNLSKLLNQPIREYYYNREDNDLRLDLSRKILTKLYHTYHPDVVVHEAAFCNPRLVAAFRSLTRAVMMINLTFFDINPDIPVREIEATHVKKVLGAKGGDKNLMTIGINRLISRGKIIYPKSINRLDEHSIDSMAIGYTYAADLLKAIGQGNYLYS